MEIQELTENDVEFLLEIEEEHTSVRGNAMVSGDDEADRELEDEILDRLDRGDLWAWCTVKVSAVWEDAEGNEVKGVAYLGCCSYENKREFKNDPLWDDLKIEALADLNSALMVQVHRDGRS